MKQHRQLLVIHHHQPAIHLATAELRTFGGEPARPSSSTTTVPAAKEGDGELFDVTMEGSSFLVAH
jgi:hypothetical protein